MSARNKCILCVDQETPDNRIFNCKGCGLSVHCLCYGISETVEMDDWLCSPCVSKPSEPVFCELCPQSNGALKKTSCGKWVHVLCALFTEGAIFEDLNQMEPIDISQISRSNVLLHECWLLFFMFHVKMSTTDSYYVCSKAPLFEGSNKQKR